MQVHGILGSWFEGADSRFLPFGVAFRHTGGLCGSGLLGIGPIFGGCLILSVCITILLAMTLLNGGMSIP